MIDLHCHSTASDGILAPAEVIRCAAEVRLTALALTDHDTMAGVPEAIAEGERLGIRVIGGCEFSVQVEWGEMHLLGYFLTPGDPELEAFLSTARADRERRSREIVNCLHRQGLAITHADVEREAAGAAIGRPHVARALLRLGHVRTLQQAFDQWLGRHRPGFIEKRLPSLRSVADLVHSRGGVVSAAHLKTHGTKPVLERLQQQGLDAVETRHPSHDGDRVANITEAAEALQLGRSGGSDWHGEADPLGTHAWLGSQQVPDQWLADLEARRPVGWPL
jgi:predicted metal-dependent phosphoesterase TrpH